MHSTRSTPSLRRAALTALALAAAALAGCAAGPSATSAVLTYETVPAGATIMQGQETLGMAPVSRRYEAAPGQSDITTPDVIAVWPSGAKTSFFTVLKPGDDRVATLERPKSAPKLEVDLAHADKVTKEMQQDKARLKEQQLRDQKRSSAACLQQMSGQGIQSPIDNCN